MPLGHVCVDFLVTIWGRSHHSVVGCQRPRLFLMLPAWVVSNEGKRSRAEEPTRLLAWSWLRQVFGLFNLKNELAGVNGASFPNQGWGIA